MLVKRQKKESGPRFGVADPSLRGSTTLMGRPVEVQLSRTCYASRIDQVVVLNRFEQSDDSFLKLQSQIADDVIAKRAQCTYKLSA